MVAVTTTRHSRRRVGSPERHLALVPGPLGAPATARCGCHRHRASAAAAARRLATGDPGLSPARVPRHTYRRRRIAAALVVAGLALAAWAALGALGGALTASGRSAPDLRTGASAEVVEVGPGDTFWSIARRLQPEGDVRPLVDRLVTAHGGAVLREGERIAVPSSS